MNSLISSAATGLVGQTIWKLFNTATVSPRLLYSDKREGKFEIQPYKLHKLETGPSTTATLSSEDALSIYEKLVKIRQIEAAIDAMYKSKLIRGFCHLYTGQEAVAVGMHTAFRDVDSVITSYRCHGWVHLMGVSVLGLISELTGGRTGCSRGKGGSMHTYSRNFYGGNGIVGAQVPLGAGIAFAHKYKNDGGVCFTFYGDGASNQGQVFEAFNMAKLWNLPCVFVCENNKYGMGTSISRSSASTNYYSRGDYIPGVKVDGMDPLATRETARYAINHCCKGLGPLLLEMDTYRYYGHSMSDPGTSYRTRNEVQEMRQRRDPINLFKEKILQKSLVTPEQLKNLDVKVRKEIDVAVQQAKTEPEAGIEELAADIYFNNVEKQIRGVHPNMPLNHREVAARK